MADALTLVNITTASQEEVSVCYALKNGGEIDIAEIIVWVKDCNEDHTSARLTRTEARSLADEILRQLQVTEPDNWSDDE